jgi:four helix bundle protein
MFNFEKLDVWHKAIDFAEGTSRSSKTDFACFIEIATGSVFEVVSQAYLSKRRSFLSDAEYQRLYGAAAEQSRMLSGLRKSLFSE